MMTKDINAVLADEWMDMAIWIVEEDYNCGYVTVVANGKVLEFGKEVDHD